MNGDDLKFLDTLLNDYANLTEPLYAKIETQQKIVAMLERKLGDYRTTMSELESQCEKHKVDMSQAILAHFFGGKRMVVIDEWLSVKLYKEDFIRFDGDYGYSNDERKRMKETAFLAGKAASIIKAYPQRGSSPYFFCYITLRSQDCVTSIGVQDVLMTMQK